MDVVISEEATGRGRLVVRRVRPGVLHSVASGHMCRSLVEVLVHAAETEMRASPDGIEHFLDWSEVGSYDSEARVLATKWALAQKPPHPRLHIVTTGRLVNMGVAAASLTLQLAGRPLHAYTSSNTFASRLNERRSTDA